MDDVNDILRQYAEAPVIGIVHEEPPRKSRWLFDFARNVCQMSDDYFEVGLQDETHAEICVEVEDILGDCQFKGSKQSLFHVEMPRFSYKTSIMEAAIVGVLTKNPNARILIVTAEHGGAQKRIKNVKWLVSSNPDFADVYGDDWRPEHNKGLWSSTQFEISKRTRPSREPSVDTASIGKDMTGSHYDVIMCDDLVNEKNSRTSEKRHEVFRYMMSTLALLDPGGSLMVWGTRWHVDDAYGMILKEDAKRVDQGKEPHWRVYIRSCWDGPNGLFFPKKLTFDFLELQKQRLKSKLFAANYENKPIADEDRLFNMEIAQRMEFVHLRSGDQNFVRWKQHTFPVETTLAWDPAGTTPTKNSDSHGITVVGTDQYDRWWIHEAIAYKALPSAVLNKICNLIAYYRPRVVIIESVGGYGLWINLLQDELISRGLSVAIIEDKVGGQSKNTRISMLEPRWSNMAMYMKYDQEVLYDQISEFDPSSQMAHEDVLDSLAKHHGNTVQAHEARYHFDNPIDYEYLEYQREHSTQDKNAPKAGRLGTRWAY